MNFIDGANLMTFSTSDFRQVMGRFATGITVVTTLRPDGGYHGITVNSFTSVSLDPPLILICIDHKTEAHRLLPLSGVYCVNILNENQMHLSNRFAGREPGNLTPFADLELKFAATGAPVFEESLGYIDCKIVNAYEGGDHTIFMGEVLMLGNSEITSSDNPLLYYKSAYGELKA